MSRNTREKKLWKFVDARYRFTVLIRIWVITISASPRMPVRPTICTGSALSWPASSSNEMPKVDTSRMPSSPLIPNVSR